MKKRSLIIILLVCNQLGVFSQSFWVQPRITGPDMICDEGTFTAVYYDFFGNEFPHTDPEEFTWSYDESNFYAISGGDGQNFITLKRKYPRAVPSTPVDLNFPFFSLGLQSYDRKYVQVGVPVINIYMDQVANPGTQTIPEGDFTMFVILGQPPGVDPLSYDYWEVQITGGQVISSGGTTFWVKPAENAQSTEIMIRATDDGCVSSPWVIQTYIVTESDGPPVLIGGN